MTPKERDDAILEHLRRFHLTTAEILHRLFFADSKLNAVRKVTARFIREKKIRPCRLFEQRKYFVLTPGQAARMGEDRSIGKPFAYQGLVNAYGVLLFSVENGSRPFTKKEFEGQFPELVIRGVGARNYYVDAEETDAGRKNRLGFMVIDYGTSPETIVKKARKITARGYTLPAFGRLIQGGNFVIAIAAPSREKAEAIKAALANEPLGPVRFRVEAAAELGELLLHRGRLRRQETDQAGMHAGKQNGEQTAELLPSTPAAEEAHS